MFETSRHIFDELRAIMRPGVSFAAILDLWRTLECGYHPGAALMHGRGLGEDRPLLMGGATTAPDLVLEEGNVFILKPACFPAERERLQSDNGAVLELAVRAGDTVTVTASGAERLGRRLMEIAAI